MKKSNAALNSTAEANFPGQVKDHEHIHAANCGHKSFVHGDHIDYLHDGHYHYYLNGKTFHCEGPASNPKSAPAKVMPFAKPTKK